MRKILLALTTAVAVGALAAPMAALAESNHSNGGSKAGGSRVSTGMTSHNFSGATFNANARGTANVRTTQNFAVNNNTRTWNGQKWASNGRHHRHHDRFFGFVPFAAYDDYAFYDNCWQTIWTPSGYQRVFVCEQNGYY
jgi:hypothetical protein